MMRHSLSPVVLLLFICAAAGMSAVVGRASACGYDEVKKRNGAPVAVVREVPKKGQGAWQAYTVAAPEGDNNNWKPLRIKVSSESLKEDKYCKNEGDKKKNLLNDEEITCTSYDVMNEEKKKLILEKILPEAIKLHTDRLLVQRMETPLKVQNVDQSGVCSRFTIPEANAIPPGMQDTDFLLYVAAGPSKNFTRLSWAVTCAVDNKSKRPLVGAMNVHPLHSDVTRAHVRFIAHELTHALGFDSQRMTAVAKTADSSRTVVNSEKVLEIAREHYDCKELKEFELEHTDEGTAASHWNRRNAKDELMSMHTPSGFVEGIGYYTALTIAAFEDMKFYKGNFSMAEPMSWGYKAGCAFLKATCKEKDKPIDDSTPCTDFLDKPCASDRLGWDFCFQPSTKTSNCPLFWSGPTTSCAKSSEGLPLPGFFGENSWCLDGDALTLNYTERKSTQNAMCAEVQCNDDSFQVRLAANGKWYTCNSENKFITPTREDYIEYESGRIKCPNYSEVCTMNSNGSSLVKPKVKETPKSRAEQTDAAPGTAAVGAATTPAAPAVDVPSSSVVSENPERSTPKQDNAQTNPDTPASRDKGREGGDSATVTAAETSDAEDTGSSTADYTTSKEHATKNKTTNHKENDPKRRKDNSQATKVYPPLLLLVLIAWTLLVSS